MNRGRVDGLDEGHGDGFGVDLPLRNLFERPTVAMLAEAIDALGWVAGTGSTPRGNGAGNREEIAV